MFFPSRAELVECGRVLRLVWPLALGMANNALMQFVDRAFLARESPLSLEAVLPAAVLSFLFTCIFYSLSAYSSVFVAQYHGACDRRGCAKGYFAGIAISAVGGVFLLAMAPTGATFFSAFGHEMALVARESAYFSIVTAAGGVICATMAASGYFTGRGRTRFVFWVNLAGNLVNVALDRALIFGDFGFPAMGIRGAAIATVASQAIQAAVLNVAAIREIFAAQAREDVVSGPPFGKLCLDLVRFGFPAAMYQLLNFLSFSIFVFLTGRIGGMAFAVSNAAFSVNYLLIAPIEGFSVGAATIVGQRQGAQDRRGAARGAWRCLWLAETYVFIATTLVLVFHRPILALFAADSAEFGVEEFVADGLPLFILMACWQFFDCAEVTISGALKGAGDTRFVMIWMLVSAFVFWMPLLFFVYSRWPTMPALWSTMIAYVIVAMIGVMLRWLYGPWRRIKMV